MKRFAVSVLIVASFALVSPLPNAQEPECWQYELEILTHTTQLGILKDHRLKTGFKSIQECSQSASESSGTEMFDEIWWGTKRETKVGPCEPCSGGGEGLRDDTGITGSDRQEIQNDFEDVMGEELGKWFVSIISPINAEGAATDLGRLLGGERGEALRRALQGLPTAAFATHIARATVELLMGLSAGAFDTAMSIIEVPPQEHRKFLAASAVYLLSAPDEYRLPEDRFLASYALMAAAFPPPDEPPGPKRKFAAAAFGIAAIVAADRGEDNLAGLLLGASMSLGLDIPDEEGRTQLIETIGKTSETYSIPMPDKDLLPSFGNARAATGGVDLSGEYTCVHSTYTGDGCPAPGTYATTEWDTIEESPLVISQIGSRVTTRYETKSTGKEHTVREHAGEDSYVENYFGPSTVHTIGECTGEIAGSVAAMDCRYISSGSARKATMSISLAGHVRTHDLSNPAHTSETEYRFDLRILADGKIELSAEGGASVYEKR